MSGEVTTDKNEIELWKKVKSNDLKAFNEFYKIYYSKLMYIGGQLNCSEEIFKDLVHDTFIEIYERREFIDIKSSLKFYLIRCFKSHLYKYLRENKKHLKLIEEEKQDVNFSFSIQQEIIQKQISQEQYDKVENEINQLTNRQREVMYYFYKEGFDYDEIAEIMSLKTRRSAQNLVYEAVKIIKSRLLAFPFILMLLFPESA
jgi:RNA polymerase sigma factor (sigma-70 family)